MIDNERGIDPPSPEECALIDQRPFVLNKRFGSLSDYRGRFMPEQDFSCVPFDIPDGRYHLCTSSPIHYRWLGMATYYHNRGIPTILLRLEPCVKDEKTPTEFFLEPFSLYAKVRIGSYKENKEAERKGLINQVLIEYCNRIETPNNKEVANFLVKLIGHRTIKVSHQNFTFESLRMTSSSLQPHTYRWSLPALDFEDEIVPDALVDEVRKRNRHENNDDETLWDCLSNYIKKKLGFK